MRLTMENISRRYLVLFYKPPDARVTCPSCFGGKSITLLIGKVVPGCVFSYHPCDTYGNRGDFFFVGPFRTAVSFLGPITYNLSVFCPQNGTAVQMGSMCRVYSRTLQQ